MNPITEVNRRHFLSTATAGAGALLVTSESHAQSPAPGGGPFNLPELPYPHDALAPHIDAKTMELHHGKHHQTYVTKLNEAVAGLTVGTLEELISDLGKVPENVRSAVRNHGGGHYNHMLFWNTMGKPGTKGVGGEPVGPIGDAIAKAFRTFDSFKNLLTDKATKLFGSGWAWLLVKADGTLAVSSTPNQDNPLMKTVVPEAEVGTPILGIDVWEHAYYLNYMNERPRYIAGWWNLINWEAVTKNFEAATK